SAASLRSHAYAAESRGGKLYRRGAAQFATLPQAGFRKGRLTMPGFLQRTFGHNLVLKLVSLLLAIGLWLVVARDPIAEVEIKVPIEFHNLPDNLEIDSASFTEAQIRVRGPERMIHRLQISDVRAEIDLTSVRPGERTFDLTGRQVHVPQDLEVVQIIPGQFHLSFDDRETRVVEVRPRVIGNFASGMRVAQVIANPPNVVITGPRRRQHSGQSHPRPSHGGVRPRVSRLRFFR